MKQRTSIDEQRALNLSRRGLLALPLAAAGLQAADLPRPAPPLAVRKPDGSAIDLADYKGKVVAIEFLLTTCPHCQQFSQLLERMYQQYGARGFQPIGIATNDMAHMLVPEFTAKFRLSFPVGYSARELAHSFLQHPTMLTMYMPQMAMVDRKGTIRYQHGGNDPFFNDAEKRLRVEIETLLGEGGAAARPPGTKKPAARKTS